MNKQSITKIEGKAVPLPQDDIDTDRIMPARYLKEITFDRMGEFLFNDVRFDANGKSLGFVIDLPQYQGAKIIFSGKNFGCGSSREHAPQAIKRFGFEAIVAESFAEIFAGNCQSLGIVPATAAKSDLSLLIATAQKAPATKFVLDVFNETIEFADKKVKISILPARKKALLDGTWNVHELLLANKEKVLKLAEKLPYVQGFK